MKPISPGDVAPELPGVHFDAGPTALFFYKVTCPVCQMAAPKAQGFEDAYPGRMVGVGQDPEDELATFGRRHGMSIRSVPDLQPYETSSAYRVRSVPTLFLVGPDGVVVDTVESWDREGYNRVSERLAELTGRPFVPISGSGDGLPPFRPG